jgi:hypothetical protein
VSAHFDFAAERGNYVRAQIRRQARLRRILTGLACTLVGTLFSLVILAQVIK